MGCFATFCKKSGAISYVDMSTLMPQNVLNMPSSEVLQELRFGITDDLKSLVGFSWDTARFQVDVWDLAANTLITRMHTPYFSSHGSPISVQSITDEVNRMDFECTCDEQRLKNEDGIEEPSVLVWVDGHLTLRGMEDKCVGFTPDRSTINI